MQSQNSFQFKNLLQIENINPQLATELGRLLLYSYEDIYWIGELLPQFTCDTDIAEFILFFKNNEDLGIFGLVDFSNILEFEEERQHRLTEWQNKIGPLSSDEINSYLNEFDISIEDYRDFTKKHSFQFSSSQEIFDHLDRHIVAQHTAKIHISTALYCHYLGMKCPDLPLPKKNMLLIGPSGSGKTYLLEVASRIAQVPFIKIDAASLVKEGIVGTSLTDYFAAKYEVLEDKSQLENALVFIDEVDKLGHTHYGPQVQTELLSLIGEGGQVNFRKDRFDNINSLKTNNMLFVLGGAFESLTNKTSTKKNVIGFSNDAVHDLSSAYSVDRNDIIDYGIMPEVMNRLQAIVPLHRLTKSNFLDMLTKTQASELISYQNFARIHGKRIRFTECFIQSLAERASESEMNGRSIKNLLSDLLLPVLIRCEQGKDKEIVIDRQFVNL